MQRIAFRSALLPAALATVLVSAPGWCTWPHDPYENLFIATNAGSDARIWGVLADGAGGAFVVFSQGGIEEWDIYAMHINAAGFPDWGGMSGMVPICTASGQQNNARALLDGEGGIFIAWGDFRDITNGDPRLTRVDANGAIHAGWPADGLVVATHAQASKNESAPQVTTDGFGGTILTWNLEVTAGTDYDVVAARVSGEAQIVWSNVIHAAAGVQYPFGIVPAGSGSAVVGFSDGPFSDQNVWCLRVDFAGLLEWGGVKDVCIFAGQQDYLTMTPDGAGGAFFVWRDWRGADPDIYASRIDGATGEPVDGWGGYGNAVCVAANMQSIPVTITDGNQGLLVAWTDYRNGDPDIFAQHLTPSGAPRPDWNLDGNAVSSFPGSHQSNPVRSIVSDGAGGFILAWNDERMEPSASDVFAVRMSGSGWPGTGWNYYGNAVSLAPRLQVDPIVVSDGANGAIVFWEDTRTPGYGSIYAQRIDRFGQLGNAEPVITSIRDVAGDQGGSARLVWDASYLDAEPSYAIGSYWIWRQAPVAAAAQALRQGARLLDADLDAEAAGATPEEWDALVRPGLFRMEITNGTAYAWEYLASQPASGFAEYSYVAPTTTDSMPASNPYTAFMVQARNAGSGSVAFWSSPADSGYSVDNLAPATPAPFTASYAGGQTTLHWGSNVESDFALYRLYRSGVADFVPSSESLISEQGLPDFVDASAGHYFYKLAAVDVHGNVSAYATAFPSGITDAAPAGRPRGVFLAPVAPSPMVGTASVRFGLPRAAQVSLAVLDASGRQVCQLVGRELEAGEHALSWRGDDASGHELPGGIYFLQLRAQGQVLVRRFAKLE